MIVQLPNIVLPISVYIFLGTLFYSKTKSEQSFFIISTKKFFLEIEFFRWKKYSKRFWYLQIWTKLNLLSLSLSLYLSLSFFFFLSLPDFFLSLSLNPLSLLCTYEKTCFKLESPKGLLRKKKRERKKLSLCLTLQKLKLLLQVKINMFGTIGTKKMRESSWTIQA